MDLTRDARRHMAFGFGDHQHLGQPLARVELQTVFPRLFRRFPDLRSATGLDQLPFEENGVRHGVCELPATWCSHDGW
ncbi:cytochrome P450 [Saccharopolyspora hordei]|uniref:cytochrome P450 n=1 Tax=Saccharopolyspora hordei TaxID=1838 RepID=UPI0031E9DBE0